MTQLIILLILLCYLAFFIFFLAVFTVWGYFRRKKCLENDYGYSHWIDHDFDVSFPTHLSKEEEDRFDSTFKSYNVIYMAFFFPLTIFGICFSVLVKSCDYFYTNFYKFATHCTQKILSLFDKKEKDVYYREQA